MVSSSGSSSSCYRDNHGDSLRSSFLLRKIKSLLLFYAQINLLLASAFFIIKINFLKTSNYDVCYITNNRIFRIFSFHFCPGPGFRRSTAQILTIGVSTTYCLTAVLFLSISSEMKMMICLVLFLSGPAICALSLLRSWANNRMMIQPTVYRAL